ncbi:hypothetical protein M1397_00570 [Candidatus Marsarchaeota archaeon]|nr:hypothetical protein [Candidatus Marsarchaeota archaeon]
MVAVIATVLVAFLSIFVPGTLIAFALLYKKTELHIFEITVIGFIFGLLGPASMTWLESFLINDFHAFSFSLWLFEINALILTIVGIILCIWQGVFRNLNLSRLTRAQQINEEKAEINSAEASLFERLEQTRAKLSYYENANELISKHKTEEEELRKKHQEEQRLINRMDAADKTKLSELHRLEEEKLAAEHEQEERLLLNRLGKSTASSTRPGIINLKTAWPWLLLFIIMILAFATRMTGISLSQHFFEFDPYFDMMAAQSILVYGQQFYTAHSAWPVEAAGSVMRIQPVIPYLEAYWYDLANYFGPRNYQTFSTNLMSYVGSVYPPITAALLVFSIFALLYREYGKYVALIAASVTASMPVLFTTFVAGEQLLEPWGIFTLFFFFAMYVLAIRDMKNTRLAILAGVAFASTFLGAHYYTVDAGVFAIYIILQGVISTLRGDINKYFFKMNIIMLIVIALFLAPYTAYKSTLSGAIPETLGIPTTIGWPMFALIFVMLFYYVPKLLKRYKIIFKSLNWKEYLGWLVILVILTLGVVIASPLYRSLKGYINVSAHYTTPSIPLFMTVQEFEPTGLLYNFGAAGIGLIAASIDGVPIVAWLVAAIGLILIAISIIFRKSTTGILYIAIALPIMFAGFSEVKYLPHLGVVLIILLGIILGELLLLADSDFSIKKYSKIVSNTLIAPDFSNAAQNHTEFYLSLIAIGLFFLSPILAIIMIVAVIALKKPKRKGYLWALFVLFIIIEIAAVIVNHQLMLGESSAILQSISAAHIFSSNNANACTIFNNRDNAIGADIFCNQVPQYWIEATQWMQQNIGPFGYRILAWWDYGDWINWFGNSPAVIRGDNSAPTEDYATAASFVLSSADGYTPQRMVNMMSSNQTKYVLYDQGLVEKWQALDFLACVDINATSKAYAIAQGQAQNPPQPYVLGTSPCEVQHDPQFILVPLPALIPTNTTAQSISFYCSISNSTTPLISSYLITGGGISNNTVCVSSQPNTKGVLQIYNKSGGKMNAVIQASAYEGVITLSGVPFVEYLMIYLPNAANGTITDAPSLFYESNYYKGFFLGSIPGFTQVYPLNATGINYVNGTYPIRIFEVDNFTGSLPPKTPKPSWVKNNYTMPG